MCHRSFYYPSYFIIISRVCKEFFSKIIFIKKIFVEKGFYLHLLSQKTVDKIRKEIYNIIKNNLE